jgi:hypothetical protein
VTDDPLFTIEVLMRRSEAERDGFGLLSAVSGLERLRWAALGCDRSAPQLLHERLPQLKTSIGTLSTHGLRLDVASDGAREDPLYLDRARP